MRDSNSELYTHFHSYRDIERYFEVAIERLLADETRPRIQSCSTSVLT